MGSKRKYVVFQLNSDIVVALWVGTVVGADETYIKP